jgi:pimeloyl-ACP methyl ester carboxylesterase
MTPAYVIGHHSGSMIGAQMAVDFPGSVRKLVVWGYPLMDEAHRQNLLNAAPLEYSADGHELQDQWNGRIAFNGPTFTTALNLRCTLERLHAGREWFRLYNAVGGADFHGVAAALDVPVLVMSGRRDMVWEESQLAAKAIRGASFLEIPGSGVYVADEQPEEFVAGVHGFFRG